MYAYYKYIAFRKDPPGVRAILPRLEGRGLPRIRIIYYRARYFGNHLIGDSRPTAGGLAMLAKKQENEVSSISSEGLGMVKRRLQ